MMNSVRLFFRNFIKYFLYIAVFAQLVSGTVYLICHFTECTSAPETQELLNVAETLVFDEYVSILYPLFLKLCLFIEETTGVFYYVSVYLMQIMTFAVALWYVTGNFFQGKKKFLVCAFVLANPMCLSTMLSVSPYAFKTVLGLVIVGAMMKLWQGTGKLYHFLMIFVSYLLSTLNERGDLYVWFVPIAVFVSVILLKKQKNIKIYKKMGILLALFFVFAVSFGVGKSISDVGARGRMQKTVSSVLFQRTLWPDMAVKYNFMPSQLRAVVHIDIAMSSDSSAEQMQYVIGPLVETAYGLEVADNLYMEAVKNQFSYNKKAIFKAVTGDFLGYALTPYSTMSYITGQEGAAFGKLYSLMSVSYPHMVYTYYCISFVALFLLTMAALLKAVKEKVVVQKEKMKKILFFAAIILYQALWYAIVNVQGVDYRYVLLNVVLFSLFAVSGILEMDCIERNAK